MRSARTHASVPLRIFRSTLEHRNVARFTTNVGARIPSAAHSRQLGVPTHLMAACSARESGYSSAAEITGLPEISSTKIAPIAHDAHDAPSGARYREHSADFLRRGPTKHRTPPSAVTRTESACTANSTKTDLQSACTWPICTTMATRARHEPTRPTRARGIAPNGRLGALTTAMAETLRSARKISASLRSSFRLTRRCVVMNPAFQANPHTGPQKIKNQKIKKIKKIKKPKNSKNKKFKKPKNSKNKKQKTKIRPANRTGKKALQKKAPSFLFEKRQAK
jgi:hypothetical protein